MNRRTSIVRTPRTARRGMTLVVAIACAAIVAALAGDMLQSALRAARQLRCERDMRQTERLLEAGVVRALQRLTLDADYHGETWELTSEQIVGAGAGRIEIAIEPADTEPAGSEPTDSEPTDSEPTDSEPGALSDDALARRVRVVARYPVESGGRDPLANRRSRVFDLPLSLSPAEE